jgi:osmoprotectant transport system permease protein
MMNVRNCWKMLLGVAIASATSLTAYGEAPSEAPGVKVGSKSFTESVVLGEMLAHLARASGFEAAHQAELGGTQILWKALVVGNIDAYVEYSGTITHQIFAGQGIRSDAEIREALAEYGVRMTRRLAFNNTYALAMKEELAGQLDIRTISDLCGHAELKLGFSDEFLERKDGWPGLKRDYGLPQTNVRGMEHNLAYRGVEKGAIDVIDVYTTDAEIPYYNLRVLEDDRGYFPMYKALVLYRSDLDPSVVGAFNRLEGKIDDGAMAELNAQAKLDRVPETVVAARFLRDQVDPEIEIPSVGVAQFYRRRLLRLIRNTWEHLFLVGISLVGAIAVAVPVGVAAYKQPRFGETILGVVGVIQTLPSLALLVFMIPLFGLGAWPAIVALFLYSLLPIVRNTYTGLHEIPPSLHESALALGLPAKARLWLVELHMASRSILAGVKTAAVINVGTATIGALIGAGGYGQPILTGIRLDDLALILQGAIPAAVLALLIQGLFGQVERYLVPKGLQAG